jgi:hypothetical protein
VNPVSERGAVLTVTLMALALMTALGAALILASSSETMIAANFRRAAEARYAAEAGLERAIGELVVLPLWTDVPAGAMLSSFVDGPPSGVRRLPDGTRLDLAEVRHLANCQRRTACSTTELDRRTPDRPWGSLNPRWQLFGYGPLPLLTSGQEATSPLYVVMMVSDDQSENDGDPDRDGVMVSAAPNPGRQRLLVRAEAFGIRGVHAVVDATIARIDTAATASAPAWSEVRILAQGEGS